MRLFGGSATVTGAGTAPVKLASGSTVMVASPIWFCVLAISTNVCAASAPPFWPPLTTHSSAVVVLPADVWPS